MDNFFVNTRSSIKLTGTKILYFDPLDIEGEPHDADMVFVTHEHYDHFSPEDIKKVLKPDSQIIVPAVMVDMIRENGFQAQGIHGVVPGETKSFDGIKCHGIPAYNIDKAFHPKAKQWLGFLVELDGKTYYAMGDTDVTPEAEAVEADVVFVPIGGKYTMDVVEAAEFINEKSPRLAVPIHYGDAKTAERFIKLLKCEGEIKNEI